MQCLATTRCQTLPHNIPSTHHHQPQPSCCHRCRHVPLRSPIWAKQGLLIVEHHAHASPPTAAATSRCVCVFTAADDHPWTPRRHRQRPPTPRHHRWWPPMPRNYHRQRPHATSQPTTTAHAISPPPTTPTRHVTTAHPSQPPRQRRQKLCHVTMAASPLLEGCGRRNQWVGSEEERGSEEAREGGTRRQGKR